MLGAVSADLNMSASVRSRAVALTCINNSPPDLSSHHVFFGSGLPQEAGRDQEIWPQDQHGPAEVSKALMNRLNNLLDLRHQEAGPHQAGTVHGGCG